MSQMFVVTSVKAQVLGHGAGWQCKHDVVREGGCRKEERVILSAVDNSTIDTSGPFIGHPWPMLRNDSHRHYKP